ncbi:sialoadhesin-like isoform X3 [Megalobrama amblycephala]|uniref:sialoadhesin-like isoform X3 n=1 Tax=Megalobrama amblycephala TaxID=75352 RepID=UPI0020146983|nr:sialoadhesin-like isoform X3 [Megalobrama amblycephala]
MKSIRYMVTFFFQSTCKSDCIKKGKPGNKMRSLLVHLFLQAVLLFDTLAWEVKIPKDIHGLKGSCLVIPCSFSYTSYPPKNPRRVVWYQWVSKGYPLVYDPLHADDVIEMFKRKTSLYGNPSNGDCSLLITNLEQSHHGEKVYAWIDPENVGWRTYAFYDVTSTILVDNHPQQPSISIYGGEKMSETITVACSTFHTCPYSQPNIILKGIEGTGKMDNEYIKDGLWKITLTCTGVVKAEYLTIECSVTHHGGKTVTATKNKSAKCVHHKITIEPELADVTEGVAKIFSCSVYHSCQKETPTITWNYKNMQVSTGRKTLSGLDQITYSRITFLGSKQDHGKKLTCTAIFSGGNTETSVVLRVQQNQKPVQILNETNFQYEADVMPMITALTRSCVVIPCSFKMEEEYVTRLQIIWISKTDGYMFHTKTDNIFGKFKGRTRLLGNPDEQNCTVEMDDVQTHDNGPFCFRAEKENKKYSFNNNCVFIIMQDIEPGAHLTVKCSVNHTCSSHPPNITWSIPTAQETISHNHMGGGVWETVSTVTFIPNGYEEKDEIVCTANFWGGKTQNNTAFLSVKRDQGVGFELYVTASSLVFILICILGVFMYKRRHRHPRHDMHVSERQSEQRPNTSTVSQNKPFSKPRIPSPKSEPKSYSGYDYEGNYANMEELNVYGNI